MRKVIHSQVVDPEAVGVEVSWSFGDGSADAVQLLREDVIELFRAHGFARAAEGVEKELEPNEALRRARGLAKNRPWLVVRELARPNKLSDVVLGVYVRRDTSGESGDGWEMAARVRHDVQAHQIECLPPEGAADFPSDHLGASGHAEGVRLAAAANLVRRTAINGEVSGALVDACAAAHCVSRRPGGGGVYLVFAGPRCEALVALLGDLEAKTASEPRHRRFAAQVQEVYPRPLTSRSWASSCEAQLEGNITRLLGDLEEMVAEGKMRETTKHKRAREADELVQLAERCRVFLADRVDALSERLGAVRAAFTAAAADDLGAAKALLAGIPPQTPGGEAPAPPAASRAAQPVPERAPAQFDPLAGI